jgi:DNA-binding LytR/AlgR family response regulator
MTPRPTALIADDEPLLREELVRLLAVAWPELAIVAQARNGREALRQFEAHRPDVCFLDVKMPGMSGIDVADRIAGRAHIAFVTAYDDFAVKAFAQGAIDYLVKPVAPERLAETVARIRDRLRSSAPSTVTPELLRALAAEMGRAGPAGHLHWIRAQVGSTVRLIAVEDVLYLRADTKYTRVAWRERGGTNAEALVRLALKELLVQLDPERFAQVHRSVVVNLAAVSHVEHSGNETARIHLKGNAEVLPVSRTFAHRFRQM